MRRKASKSVQLVLITSVLASCATPQIEKPAESTQRVFMRADTTAPYTEVTNQYAQSQSSGGGMGSALLWYMAFRHMGGGLGYANQGLHPQSVTGTNTAKASAYQAQRGGFGRTATMNPSNSAGA
jgi:hypothetical protein